MSTLLERLVGDQDSLGSPDWKKPQYLLDAIAKRKKKSRTSQRAFCPNGTGGGISNTCGDSEGGNMAPPIDSPKFKEWFSGSKVVDSSGSPLVVYHGTSSEFDEFDPAASPVNDDGYMGAGSYFIADKKLATQYSLMASDNKPGTPRVVAAYLSIETPVVISQSDQTYGMTREELDRIVGLK
jgi:hypothetical protein